MNYLFKLRNPELTSWEFTEIDHDENPDTALIWVYKFNLIYAEENRVIRIDALTGDWLR